MHPFDTNVNIVTMNGWCQCVDLRKKRFWIFLWRQSIWIGNVSFMATAFMKIWRLRLAITNYITLFISHSIRFYALIIDSVSNAGIFIIVKRVGCLALPPSSIVSTYINVTRTRRCSSAWSEYSKIGKTLWLLVSGYATNFRWDSMYRKIARQKLFCKRHESVGVKSTWKW